LHRAGRFASVARVNELMTAVAELFDPASFSPGLTLAAAASILAAAFLRGLTGFGFALAAVPLMSLFLAPVVAVPLVICLQLAGNLFEIRTSLKQCHWPSLSWLALGTLIGTPIGMLALALFPASAARLAIAAVTAAALLILTRGFAFKLVPGAHATLPVGTLAGLFNGLAGMPGPPVIAYYMASPVSRIAMRASLNVFFLINAVIALASALGLGLITWGIALCALAGLPLMFAGQWLGLRYFHRGSDRTHRLIAMVSLGAIALGAAVKGLSGLL
jgi:uncharacterized membrane protein YfcA